MHYLVERNLQVHYQVLEKWRLPNVCMYVIDTVGVEVRKEHLNTYRYCHDSR